MQVNTLPSCSKSGNFAKANLELEIEGSYRKMIPFFNFTAMYLLKLYRSFASLGYCRMMCDEDECLACAVSGRERTKSAQAVRRAWSISASVA